MAIVTDRQVGAGTIPGSWGRTDRSSPTAPRSIRSWPIASTRPASRLSIRRSPRAVHDRIAHKTWRRRRVPGTPIRRSAFPGVQSDREPLWGRRHLSGSRWNGNVGGRTFPCGSWRAIARPMCWGGCPLTCRDKGEQLLREGKTQLASMTNHVLASARAESRKKDLPREALSDGFEPRSHLFPSQRGG
jgi:hypothetical protein